MPRDIPAPRIGKVNSIQFDELETLTNICHIWRQETQASYSPVKGVSHTDPLVRPKVPTIPKIEFQYSAMLPLMRGKYLECEIELF